MHLKSSLLALAATVMAGVAAHADHAQEPIAGPHKGLWYNALPGDGGTQVRKQNKSWAGEMQLWPQKNEQTNKQIGHFGG